MVGEEATVGNREGRDGQLWGKQDRNKQCRGWGTTHRVSSPRELRLKRNLKNLSEVREKPRPAEAFQESQTLLKVRTKSALCHRGQRFSNVMSSARTGKIQFYVFALKQEESHLVCLP